MGLGRKIVYLIGLHILNYPDKIGGIRHVSVMENKIDPLLVLIPVEMIDAVGIKKGTPPFYAVNFIAFGQEQFRKIRPVLAGNSRYQRFFFHATLITSS
jgi:hypothetical protein